MTTRTSLVSVLLLTSALSLSACGKSLTEKAALASKEIGVPITVTAPNDDRCANEQFGQIYKDWKKLSKSQRAEVGAKLRSLQEIVVNPTVQTATRTGEISYLMMVSTHCNRYYNGGRYYGGGYPFGRGRYYDGYLGYDGYPGRYDGFWDPSYDVWPVSRWDRLDWYPSSQYSCSSSLANTKLIADHSMINGTAPATQILHGIDSPVLAISTQSMLDQTRQRNYITYWWSIYDRVRSDDDSDFMNAMGRGFIRSTFTQVYDSKTSCGKLARLSDLVSGTALGETLAREQAPVAPVYSADLSND